MDDYKDIKELFTPRHDIKASDELRCKVRKALNRNSRVRKTRTWLLGGVGFSTVAAIFLLVFIPSGMSAKEMLSQAIEAIGSAESIKMNVEVRTHAVENFRHIGLDDNFVTHHIDIVKSDSLLRWRIDKGERMAMGNDREIYTWIPALSLGWHINDSDNENVLGYMSALLAPWKILETELDNCVNNCNAEYKVSKTKDEIILTIHSEPQGDFDNPYLLNTSIAESESIRKYVIEAESKRLKTVMISVVSGRRVVPVLKVSDIRYDNSPSEYNYMLPNGIKFVEFDNQPDGLNGLSAEEAASTFLNAFADWDEDVIDKMLERELQHAFYREYYQGAKLCSIGRAFMSGSGNSVFVPYTLKLRDGTSQRHNIALQRTNSGGWVVAGGL